MNKLNKTIVSSIISLSVVTMAYAAEIPTMAVKPVSQSTEMMALQPHILSIHKVRHHDYRFRHLRRHGFGVSWRRALRRTHQLSLSQAKVVAQAALILYGNQTMRVGDVSVLPRAKGLRNYRIQLVDRYGKTLSTLIMNGRNGRIIHQQLS